MSSIYRDILRHSSIYGLGQILGRIASILLVPLYTSYLRPAQYGCIAILDLTVAILAILVGAGMSAAVSRYHFEAEDAAERNRVWGSGFAFLIVSTTLVVLPVWLLRDRVAAWTLGADEVEGGYYYSLVLPTLWFGVLGELANTYLRVRKWSVLFLVFSLGRLLLNITLNVLFLAGFKMGVAGVLLGNLLAGAVYTCVLFGVVFASERRIACRWSLIVQLMKFGLPILGTAFLGLLMHSADLYILLPWIGKAQVGIYQLANQVGSGVNTLLHMPFVAIWTVVIYEIARQPAAKQIYARVFDFYVSLLGLVMLGVSLFAVPIVRLIAARDFAAAADYVPIICLAYLFFAMHKHFEVPALLAKRTVSMLPSSLVAAACTIGLNLLLVPWWGSMAAAWVRVVAYAAFSFIGLLIYRRIDRYDYQLARIGGRLGGMIGTWVGCRLLLEAGLGQVWVWLLSGLAWVAWAVVLFGPLSKQLYNNWRQSQVQAADSEEFLEVPVPLETVK